MELKIIKIDDLKKKVRPTDETKLGFGKTFTDHFFNMEYHPDHGWHKAQIEPYRMLPMDPASMVFHYAQEIFEGMKAYRRKDGGVNTFRTMDNWRRMNRSAKRLCMPEIDINFVNNALKELLRLDQDWVPRSRGNSLYIRPTMIASEAAVGVKVSSEFIFFIITSPVGTFYPEGFDPIKIYVDDQYVRAARGGLGEAKTGANYAASLFPAQEAKKKGFGQVLWLDAIERKYIEEVGTMNIAFRFEDEVITSPLGGTILPGITRDSALTLVREWGMKCTERHLSIDEVIDGAKSGKLKEVFGIGTAAVISPVGELHYKGTSYSIGGGKTGELSQRLFNEILQIQYGEKEDTHGWVDRVV
jgi:branched-chain amino acid aminotransferase